MRIIVAFMFVVLFGSSANAQVPPCSYSPSALQNLINNNIVSGVPGGIRAPTVNSDLQAMNECYVNEFALGAGVMGALEQPLNTLGGLASLGVGGLLPVALGGTGTASPSLVGGTNVTITGSWPNQTINSSGGNVSSTIMMFNTSAAFQTALSLTPSLFAQVLNVTVQNVNPPSPYYGTCGITYNQNPTSTGTYGEIYGAGFYWTPQYQTTPSVLACQFAGMIGGASLPQGGTFMYASSNGTNTITLSVPQSLPVGWNIASINWHSLGSAAIPVSTITGGSGTTYTLSNTIPTASSLYLVAWEAFTPATVGGTDVSGVLNAANNFASANKASIVDVPQGTFLVSGGSIIQTPIPTGFYTNVLRGQPGPYAGIAGTAFVCTMTDRPCIFQQQNTNSGLENIAVYGPNFNFEEYGINGPVAVSPDPLDYLDPTLNATGTTPGGLQNNSFLACYAIDPYADSAPSAPYPTPSPITYGLGYGTSPYFKNVAFKGCPVGTASGINTNNQGDFPYFDTIQCQNFIICIGLYNGQLRSPLAKNFSTSAGWATFDNISLGAHDGTFNAHIDGVSTGQQWQIFNITPVGGPLVVDAVYGEQVATIGNFNGQTAYTTGVIINGILLSTYESAYGIIPLSYITTETSVIINHADINGSNRMTNLQTGGSLTCNDCKFGSSQAGPGGSSAVQQAINASGGILFGSVTMNTSKQNNAHITGSGTFFTTTNVSSLTTNGIGDYLDFIGGFNNGRAQVSPSTRYWTDQIGKTWTIDQTILGLIDPTDSGTVSVPPALSGDQLTFTLTLAAFANYGENIQPGWIITHSPENTNFIVTSVTCTTACAVVATEQNNIRVNTSNVFTAQLDPTLPAKLLSGYFVTFPTDIWEYYDTEYCTLTSGSPTATSCNHGDGNCPNMTQIVANDLIPGLGHGMHASNVPTQYQWPFSSGSYIASVAASPTCSVTFHNNSEISGNIPLTSIRAH